MQSNVFLRYIGKFTLYFAQFFAYIPFYMDQRRNVLHRYRFHRVYASMFVGILMSGNTICCVLLYPDLFILWSSSAVNVVMTCYGCMYLLTYVLTYVNHHVNLDRLETLLKKGQLLLTERIRPLLAAHEVDTRSDWTHILLFVFKEGIVQLLLTHSFLVKIWILSPQYAHNYLLQLFTILPLQAIAMVPRLYYAAMLTANFYFRQLNAVVRRIVESPPTVDTSSHFHAQRTFCEMSDQLDAVADVHLLLSELVQQLGDIVQVQQNAWIGFKVISILVQLFFCYMFVSNSVTETAFGLPYELLVSGVGGSALCAVEVMMLAHMCLCTKEEVCIKSSLYVCDVDM